jgi:hypothetical protein
VLASMIPKDRKISQHWSEVRGNFLQKPFASIKMVLVTFLLLHLQNRHTFPWI